MKPGDPIAIREGVDRFEGDQGLRRLDRALAAELLGWEDVRFEEVEGEDGEAAGSSRGVPPGLRHGRYRIDRPVPALSAGWLGFGDVLEALTRRGLDVRISASLGFIRVEILDRGEILSTFSGPYRPGEYYNGGPEALAHAALEAARRTSDPSETETD